MNCTRTANFEFTCTRYVECRPKASCHCQQKQTLSTSDERMVNFFSQINFFGTRKFWFHLYQILTCSYEYKFVDCRPKASCKHCQQTPSWCKLFNITNVTMCCFKSLLVLINSSSQSCQEFINMHFEKMIIMYVFMVLW